LCADSSKIEDYCWLSDATVRRWFVSFAQNGRQKEFR
jgi:hypothetical protein